MSLFEAITAIECAAEEIKQSRSVLVKAMEYFDFTDKEHRSRLPYYADMISDLLSVTNTLMYGIEGDLKEIVRKSEGGT